MKYWNLIAILAGCSLTAAVQAQYKIPDAVPFEPIIYAVKTSDKMVVDGKDTEACYAKAPRSSSFVTLFGNKVEPTSDVRVVYNDKKIYFFYDCYELADAEPARETDSVELFINGTEEDRSMYYQIYATLNGNFVVNRKRARYEDPVGLQEFEVKFQRKGKGFTCEIAISRTMFSQNPNILWRVNFNRSRPRNDYPKMYTCWSVTGTDFHSPARFGYMILGDRKEFIRGYYGEKAAQRVKEIRELAVKYPKVFRKEELSKLDDDFKKFEASLKGDPKIKDGEDLLKELEKFWDDLMIKLITQKFGR